MMIKRLTEELAMPITITGVPTVREENGLAMSSRNQYLFSINKHLLDEAESIIQK